MSGCFAVFGMCTYLQICAARCVVALRVQQLNRLLGKVTHALIVGIAFKSIGLALVMDQFPVRRERRKDAGLYPGVCAAICRHGAFVSRLVLRVHRLISAPPPRT